jgi:hypothetical protein
VTEFTEEQIDEINRCVRGVVVRVDERLDIIQRQIDNFARRISPMLQRLDSIEERCDIMQGRIAALKKWQDSLDDYSATELDGLLAQCNPTAPISAEEREWLDAPAVGREIDMAGHRPFKELREKMSPEAQAHANAEAVGLRAELESAWLAHDLPEHGLRAGDRGTIVLVYGGGESLEVEFAEKGIVVTLPRHALVGEDHD